jgi:long-subunit acyl-CoA synthetase (AMP-forming)
VPQLLKSLLTVFHSRRAKDPQSSSLRELFGGRIRYLWTGTAPIDEATLLEYEREGIPVYEGYGMSETGLIAKNYPGARRIGSVGKLFPDKFLELGPAGEVVIRSDYHTNDRYWRGEDEGVFLPGGRVATGDVGRLDQDGFLYLIGRTREAIVLRNGFKVFPATVEQRLLSTGLVRDCLVYGQAKPYLVALIVPAAAELTDSQIIEALARANQDAPLPEQVHAFLRVPESKGTLRNVAGKLDRPALYARFEAGLQSLYGQRNVTATKNKSHHGDPESRRKTEIH